MVDLSFGSELYIIFDQEPEKRYRLAVTFEGCAPGAKATVVVSSWRGAQSVEFVSSDMTTYFTLDDVLWNVTGARFDTLSNRYQVLKDTLLMFEVSRDYGWNLSYCESWNWDFDEGTWTGDRRPTHVYETIGIYFLNVTFGNLTSGSSYEIGALLEVVESQPATVVEIYQEVDVTLTVAGRKGNVVAVRIYEDGFLVRSADVTRTAGQPDSITLELAKCLGRTYEIELVYDAAHRGANPTWLNLTSGSTVLTLFKEFNTRDGFQQVVPVPASYLDGAAAGNPEYVFDASGSYDIDGEIVSYHWDFGDGATSDGASTRHAYSADGVYVVRLTVTDDDGLAATAERETSVAT
jgi:hypothetical protein